MATVALAHGCSHRADPAVGFPWRLSLASLLGLWGEGSGFEECPDPHFECFSWYQVIENMLSRRRIRT